MRPLAIGFIAIGVLFVPVSYAQTPGANATCAAQLQSLTAEWNRIGFSTPSKPGQQRVVGRHGHESSGPEVTYILSQIRIAAQACREGRQQEATRRIEKTRELLDRTAARGKRVGSSAPT